VNLLPSRFSKRWKESAKAVEQDDGQEYQVAENDGGEAQS
jgi:hypothetical protein